MLTDLHHLACGRKRRFDLLTVELPLLAVEVNLIRSLPPQSGHLELVAELVAVGVDLAVLISTGAVSAGHPPRAFEEPMTLPMHAFSVLPGAAVARTLIIERVGLVGFGAVVEPVIVDGTVSVAVWVVAPAVAGGHSEVIIGENGGGPEPEQHEEGERDELHDGGRTCLGRDCGRKKLPRAADIGVNLKGTGREI